MKRALSLVCVVFFMLVSIGWGECKESAKKLQEFQRQIGNDLIGIKKQYPNTQMQVYTVLDQLSKYYSFSKNLISKKKRYKKLLQTELSNNELLKKNIGEMRKNEKKMKRAISAASKKLKSNDSDSQKLKQERDTLISEKEKWELERNSLLQERDVLAQERDAIAHEKEEKANSTSAPRSPR